MEIEQLYKEIQPNIYAFFYVKTLNKEVAEDLTQEVFYQAIKSYRQFSGNSTVKTWVFAIANNLLKKHYRHKQYKFQLAERLQSEEPMERSTEEMMIEKEEKLQLIQLINNLDGGTKEIVTLRVYGELSFKEIASLMNISENYARITFHRAKLKLQKELIKSE